MSSALMTVSSFLVAIAFYLKVSNLNFTCMKSHQAIIGAKISCLMLVLTLLYSHFNSFLLCTGSYTWILASCLRNIISGWTCGIFHASTSTCLPFMALWVLSYVFFITLTDEIPGFGDGIWSGIRVHSMDHNVWGMWS